jgi:hypothetical protein
MTSLSKEFPSSLVTSPSDGFLPSPACGGGWPKAGRGLRSMRSEATLISSRRRGVDRRLLPPSPFLSSGAARRMERRPLPPFGHPPPPSGGGEFIGRIRHHKSLPASSLRGAQRRGNPVRSMRSAATLIFLRREMDGAFHFPSSLSVSGAARRLEQRPLPPFGHPPPPSGGGEFIGRIRYHKSLPASSLRGAQPLAMTVERSSVTGNRP